MGGGGGGGGGERKIGRGDGEGVCVCVCVSVCRDGLLLYNPALAPSFPRCWYQCAQVPRLTVNPENSRCTRTYASPTRPTPNKDSLWSWPASRTACNRWRRRSSSQTRLRSRVFAAPWRRGVEEEEGRRGGGGEEEGRRRGVEEEEGRRGGVEEEERRGGEEKRGETSVNRG